MKNEYRITAKGVTAVKRPKQYADESQPFGYFLLDENDPMNFRTGINHVYSRNLPIYHCFANGIIPAPRDNIRKSKYHFGPKVYRMKIAQNESIDTYKMIYEEVA